MKVKCIINNYIFLTIDKIYDVICFDYKGNYIIIDDYDNMGRYEKENFKSLSEIRNERIDKLLEDESSICKE